MTKKEMQQKILSLEKQLKLLYNTVNVKNKGVDLNMNNNLNTEKDIEKTQINIYDIGKYLLDNCPQIYGSGITQLQKLLYYAQAEYLIRYHKPLFKEEIQAWDYGPVIPTVYFEFVKYYAEKKDMFKYKCSKNPLSNEIIKILKLVINKHGKKGIRTLIEQTHKEEPWKTTYHPNKKLSNAVITLEKIYNFFQNNK